MSEAERFAVTQTIYGSPGIYDRAFDRVAPFVNDEGVNRALEHCMQGHSLRYAWRPAHEGEHR